MNEQMIKQAIMNKMAELEQLEAMEKEANLVELIKVAQYGEMLKQAALGDIVKEVYGKGKAGLAEAGQQFKNMGSDVKDMATTKGLDRNVDELGKSQEWLRDLGPATSYADRTNQESGVQQVLKNKLREALIKDIGERSKQGSEYMDPTILDYLKSTGTGINNAYKGQYGMAPQAAAIGGTVGLGTAGAAGTMAALTPEETKMEQLKQLLGLS
jgi:hypothetical protein